MIPRTPFENQMSKNQTIIGWFFVVIHIFVLPLLINMYSEFSLEPLSEITANIIYYAVGAVFVLTVMLTFLRRNFDNMCDNPIGTVIGVFSGLGFDYLMSMLVSMVLIYLLEMGQNPNNDLVQQVNESSGGMIRGLGVYIVPLIEETLFRGVVFGSVRKKSRIGAYIVSIIVFAIYHVWQAAYAYADWTLLVYALQYIPASIALAWAYERSNTIWAPIFMHMFLNNLAFAVLSLL